MGVDMDIFYMIVTRIFWQSSENRNKPLIAIRVGECLY